MFDLKEALKNLPNRPGVYLMHSEDDTVIYVGKAKILKNRVRQYFQNNSSHTPKVRAMVSHIAYFEYIVTDTELEALMLECNLIKKYRPRYNILLKDDKHYPYLKITINKEYPQIIKTRELKNDGAKYFGPYMGVNTIKNNIEIIQKIFKPPTCKRRFPQDIGKGRPCLNKHINNCFAPCTGNVSKEEYQRVFYEICSFLEGDHKKLLDGMKNEMKAAAENYEYEKAARIRDKIKAVEALSEKQKIINSDLQTDLDVIATATAEDKCFAEIFFIRAGKINGHENYKLDCGNEFEIKEIMCDFIKQFYLDKSDIPPLILTETKPDDCEMLGEWLSKKRGKKTIISVPQRGEKKKLMLMVKKNAETAAGNWVISKLKEKEKNNVLSAFSKMTGLAGNAERIEAYDVSNISGADNVSAMVVFENGKPAKSKYRKFKIKTVDGSDDYASMKETLYRRLRHALEEEESIAAGRMKESDAKFLPYPDVILIDGGKGHLSAALEILRQTETDIPCFGMVKDNKHRTRALISENGEIGISAVTGVFNFVTRIQDEVHAAAVSYHHSVHKKTSMKSELEDIDGIGEKRRNALLLHFKTMSALREAELEEIESVDGMTKKSAEAVWNYFHKE